MRLTFNYIRDIILVHIRLIKGANIMAINRNVVVTVPDDAYVEKNANVFIKDKNEYDPLKQYNRVKHTIIGRAIGNGKMYPNSNFRLRYPAIFEEMSGEKLPRQTKMYRQARQQNSKWIRMCYMELRKLDILEDQAERIFIRLKKENHLKG